MHEILELGRKPPKQLGHCLRHSLEVDTRPASHFHLHRPLQENRTTIHDAPTERHGVEVLRELEVEREHQTRQRHPHLYVSQRLSDAGVRACRGAGGVSSSAEDGQLVM